MNADMEQMKHSLQSELLSLSEGILPPQEVIDGHAGDYDGEGNLVGDLSQFEYMEGYEFV